MSKKIIHIKNINMRVTDVFRVGKSLKTDGYTAISFLGDSLKDEYVLVIPLDEESDYLKLRKGDCLEMKKIIYKKGKSYSQEIMLVENFNKNYRIDKKYEDYYRQNKKEIKQYLAYKYYYKKSKHESVIAFTLLLIMIGISLFIELR